MKTSLFICFLIFWNFSYSQTILYELKKDKRTRRDKEMIVELTESFKQINDSLKIDLNKSDTLFIIRGVDIQSRTGYGYVWNNRLMTSYVNNKVLKKKKIISSILMIEIKTDSVRWNEFENIIPFIEKWDTTEIKNYIDKCDEVLSGIGWWTIIRLIKPESTYHIDLINVRNFGLCSENDAIKN